MNHLYSHRYELLNSDWILRGKSSVDKKYSEFKETYPVQLNFFGLLDIHKSKRDKYSGTTGLYDNIPKNILLETIIKIDKKSKIL